MCPKNVPLTHKMYQKYTQKEYPRNVPKMNPKIYDSGPGIRFSNNLYIIIKWMNVFKSGKNHFKKGSREFYEKNFVGFMMI